MDVPFNLNDFVIIGMHKSPAASPASQPTPQSGWIQIHLLCLNKNNEKDKLLAEILRRERILSDQAQSQYFPGDAANTYS